MFFVSVCLHKSFYVQSLLYITSHTVNLFTTNITIHIIQLSLCGPQGHIRTELCYLSVCLPLTQERDILKAQN